MFEKSPSRRVLIVLFVAVIAGVAEIVNLTFPPPPGQNVEAQSEVHEELRAHIVMQSRHSGRITTAALSPDGRTVLTGSFYSIKLWDVASGHLLSPTESEA